jgi:hypothetical protein
MTPEDREKSQAELESLIREEKAIYERTIKGYEFDTITGELMQRLQVLEKVFKTLEEEIIQIVKEQRQSAH